MFLHISNLKVCSILVKYVTIINNNVWNVYTMGPVKGYFPSPGFCHPHYLPILSHFQTACVACACILFEK